MGPHTTSDDPTRYRSDEEVAGWRSLDPIARCETYLRRVGAWDDAMDERARARAAELRTALRDAVFDASDGPADEVFDHVFGHPTEALETQRAELLAELGRGG
jgi:pyruvate dehydrogenase E1 component alpha subunit